MSGPSWVSACTISEVYLYFFIYFATLLFTLTKKGRVFEWEEECQAALYYLKTVLTTTPVLVRPNDQDKYILDCDTSNLGFGAILWQRIDVEEWVTLYVSRFLSARNITIVLPEKSCRPWSTSRNCTASIRLIAVSS